MYENPFKKCCSQRGWLIKNNQDRREASHLLMDGGKLHIPPEDDQTFLQLISNTLVSGTYIPCVVELRTNIFRFMMDLDIECPEDSTLETFEPLFSFLREASFHFWDVNGSHDNPHMIICAAPEKKRSGGKPGKKLGIHVVWPEIYTTPQVACAFRQLVLPLLDTEMMTSIC